MAEAVETRAPTRLSSAVFGFKSAVLKLCRSMQDVCDGVRRCPYGPAADFPHVVAESRTPLWTEESPAERTLQEGKVQNLRCALRRLNGTVVPAHGLFSFWKQIGRATRRRGYVLGRQLRDGCLYPAVGGGLCQLSNALYDIALQAGCEVVERHPHSHVVPGSAAHGRDATVAWNYIDLRFRSTQPLRIEARLTQEDLIVRLGGQSLSAPGKSGLRPGRMLSLTLQTSRPEQARPLLNIAAHSCATCGTAACFRHSSPAVKPGMTGAFV